MIAMNYYKNVSSNNCVEMDTYLLVLYIFSALAIAEGSREAYPDEEGSLSGSMISLAHSNSSTSFPAGSL